MRTNQKNLPSNRAASYVRTATTPQQDSISNQVCAIREYAKRCGMQIVKEYFDEGKSGLNVQDRESLTQLIRDVQNGQINLSSVLLYDVSRWGRFQAADESAYYEYIFRQAGVSVHYCAFHLERNDGPDFPTTEGGKEPCFP
jgi:DNA invertase Pin-like site-specific DNA recombinase